MKPVLFIGGLLAINIGLYVYSLVAGLFGTGVAMILVSIILEYEVGEAD